MNEVREARMVLPEVTSNNTVRSFLAEVEDTVYHVIETGFVTDKRRYLVVNENAYQDKNFGKTEFVTKRELFNTYGIKL